MFKLNDRVIEVGTNTRGVVIDLDDSIDKPYGVLFEDVDEDNGVWWCGSDMIKQDKENNYDVKEFLKKIYEENNKNKIITLVDMAENKQGEPIEQMYDFPFNACKEALEFKSDIEATRYFRFEYIHDDVDEIIAYCQENGIEYVELF